MDKEDKGSIPYNITLIVTEDCNLRCSYCFEPEKRKRAMDFSVARCALDKLLSVDNGFKWVNIEFSGGEPLLNFGLIREVFYYVKKKTETDHRKITFNVGTNGTVLTEEMRKWFSKFSCISIGLSLDGTKEVHDLNRSGSYDAVMQNIDFFKRYDVPVKMTIGPATINRLSESIIHIHSLGFNVEANVVFEDAWGNPEEKSILLKTYAKELEKLVDFYDQHRKLKPPFLIEGALEALLQPWDADYKFCGSGKSMVAVDPEGKFFPCHRFAPIACRRFAEKVDFAYKGTKPECCANCRIRRLCHSCLGYNYERYGTIDHRTIHHCEFVKLQMRAGAQFRYRTICKVFKRDLNITLAELKFMADAVIFIEKNVETTEEICARPLNCQNREAVIAR